MKPEDVYVFNTPDVPGYKFVAARGENLVYKVEFGSNITMVDSINRTIKKAAQQAKEIAAYEGFNCIVNLNPDPKFYAYGNGTVGCFINLNFTMGTLYL